MFGLGLEVESVGLCLDRAEEAPSHDRVECKQLSCPPWLSGHISPLSLNPPLPASCSCLWKEIRLYILLNNVTQGV